MPAGTYRFEHLDLQIEQLDDLQQIRKVVESNEPGKLLLKVTLTGHLSGEELAEMEKEIQAIGEELFWFRYDSSRVMEKVNREKIDQEFTENSLPYRVLETLIEEEDEMAAQKAYQLIKEARNENR